MARTTRPNVMAIPAWETAPFVVWLIMMAPQPAKTSVNVPKASAMSLRRRGVASRLSSVFGVSVMFVF